MTTENKQYNLPNSTTVLVLGIISIATCWLFGIIGIACGIIALIMASNGLKLYKNNPELYADASLSNINAGKICAIVGVSLSGLYLLFLVIYFLLIGAALSLGDKVLQDLVNV